VRPRSAYLLAHLTAVRSSSMTHSIAGAPIALLPTSSVIRSASRHELPICRS
jgi:hypothetical protein